MAHPLVPATYRVVARRVETDDITTLSIEPTSGSDPPFRPGQFNMLTAFGVGEVAISISSAPDTPGPMEHTIRDVGAVTHALCRVQVGSILGVRGPFGTDWGVDELDDADVVVVAGGIGLAPLRGAISYLVDKPGRRGRVYVLAGARSPDQVTFAEDLERWRRDGADVELTVDVAPPEWRGPVGVVTGLLPAASFDPPRTVALVCGPEIMMRFTIRSLVDLGVRPGSIRVSLERNMQCGVGWCGHCQLGPLLLCRDGPVIAYSEPLARLMSVREL
ncbi:MAG TPA: FAD/NAD(P)-binding protein [Acidimicrobiales bacterium]|nr:FAD/NAD(P)-binding protein [Acidimicrobiales bacterium]